jgi:hypothetical protein
LCDRAPAGAQCPPPERSEPTARRSPTAHREPPATQPPSAPPGRAMSTRFASDNPTPPRVLGQPLVVLW